MAAPSESMSTQKIRRDEFPALLIQRVAGFEEYSLHADDGSGPYCERCIAN